MQKFKLLNFSSETKALTRGRPNFLTKLYIITVARKIPISHKTRPPIAPTKLLLSFSTGPPGMKSKYYLRYFQQYKQKRGKNAKAFNFLLNINSSLVS